MNAIRCFLILGVVILIGCSKAPDAPKPDTAKADAGPTKAKELTPEKEAKIEAALAKLSEVDQPLAQAQKFCPIQKTRLGSMGKPDRIEVEGQPVFLCCSSCEEEALANAKKTLDQVALFKKGLK
jgi:hypothetical protein